MIQLVDRQYKVLVNCMTYNQSKYILDALNGFVMQKTNFPFVCLVMDDASTDGEQEVIRDFLDRECAMESAEFSEVEEANIVIVPHKTNPNCTMAVYFLKKNLWGTDKKDPLIASWRNRCTYEATCEGDDYWIDPGKLQKQIDILDSHPEVSLVHTDFYTVDEDKNIITLANFENLHYLAQSGNVMFKLMIENHIMTLTMCYRIDVIESELYRGTHSLDYALSLAAASLGDIYYIHEKTSCYRQAPNSLIHTRLSEIRSISKNVRFYFYINIIRKKITGRLSFIQRLRLDYFMLGIILEEKGARHWDKFRAILKANPLKIYIIFLLPVYLLRK